MLKDAVMEKLPIENLQMILHNILNGKTKRNKKNESNSVFSFL
jgi:hypothetical protein